MGTMPDIASEDYVMQCLDFLNNEGHRFSGCGQCQVQAKFRR
jgi:hypothetical protein